ncbi:MAG: hypothetical protein GY765_05030 [bacterium]|nr:hypothetical protein [bacterium]
MKKNKLLIIAAIVLLPVLLLITGCKLTEQPVDDTTTPGSSYDPQGLYATSGHADSSSEAFRHWDEDDPPLVSTSCAKCHSNDGFLDFLDNGVVDAAATPGVIGCGVCHTDTSSGATRDLGSVIFPSGAVVGGLGSEAICMQCHQGRSSKDTVDSYLASRSAGGEDGVNPSISFRNVHYYPAGATLYGTLARGGFQYGGMMYDAKFSHTEGYQSCADCHDPHSLQVKTEECSQCHSGGVHDIRTKGSLVDYDGDGNTDEGIYYEIVTLQEYLYNAMWGYSNDVCGTPIVYESHSYPYFFKDTNGNGVADASEANYGNSYRLFTPRLLKAAYNYQMSQKDPGAFAHGGKYMIQLLYDSVMSINGAAPNPIALPGLRRGDEGHFDGSTEAWRHWDDDDEVSASCAKCHSAEGLPYYLQNGEHKAQHIANGLMCSTCHTTIPSLHEVNDVVFPSGERLSLADGSNLCMNCHQGRASKYTVDQKIAASAGPYTFSNIHYFPVAAVLFGTDAKGGYEYNLKTYVGRKLFANHGDNFDTCVECHMGTKGADYTIGHNVMKPNPADCVICHGRDDSQPYPGRDPDKFKFSGIRPGSTPDYDGDGNMTESIKAEIQGLEAALYYQLQCYSMSIGKPIIYDSHAYPYFFSDKNGNGLVDPGEANYGNRYKFDDKLLRAAYNYQVSRKEPHGYIHNSMYVAQLLVDSIGDLGGNVAPYTWR